MVRVAAEARNEGTLMSWSPSAAFKELLVQEPCLSVLNMLSVAVPFLLYLFAYFLNRFFLIASSVRTLSL